MTRALMRFALGVVVGAVAVVVAWGAVGAAAKPLPGVDVVVVSYSGTEDQSSVYEPNDPAVLQKSMQFAWAESETVSLSGAEPKVLSSSLTVSGSLKSTYAPPNTIYDCTGTLSTRLGASAPLSVSDEGAEVSVSADMPEDGDYVQSTGAAGSDCAITNAGFGADDGHIPASVDNDRAKAVVVMADLHLPAKPYTKTFTAVGSDPQDTESLHSTFKATACDTVGAKDAATASETASCSRCPSADTALRKQFNDATSGPTIDHLPNYDTAFVPSRNWLKAFVNAAQPRTRVAERQALDEHVAEYLTRVRDSYEKQLEELETDEAKWLARAQCPDTKHLIEEQFQSVIESFGGSYHTAADVYPEYLAHAIQDQCGCGGVKRDIAHSLHAKSQVLPDGRVPGPRAKRLGRDETEHPERSVGTPLGIP